MRRLARGLVAVFYLIGATHAYGETCSTLWSKLAHLVCRPQDQVLRDQLDTLTLADGGVVPLRCTENHDVCFRADRATVAPHAPESFLSPEPSAGIASSAMTAVAAARARGRRDALSTQPADHSARSCRKLRRSLDDGRWRSAHRAGAPAPPLLADTGAHGDRGTHSSTRARADATPDTCAERVACPDDDCHHDLQSAARERRPRRSRDRAAHGRDRVWHRNRGRVRKRHRRSRRRRRGDHIERRGAHAVLRGSRRRQFDARRHDDGKLYHRRNCPVCSFRPRRRERELQGWGLVGVQRAPHLAAMRRASQRGLRELHGVAYCVAHARARRQCARARASRVASTARETHPHDGVIQLSRPLPVRVELPSTRRPAVPQQSTS